MHDSVQSLFAFRATLESSLVETVPERGEPTVSIGDNGWLSAAAT